MKFKAAFNYTLIIGIAIIVFTYCKNSDSLNIKATTPSGFEYIIHKKGEGREVKYGEVAYFHTIETIDDTLVSANSYLSGNLRKIPVLRPEENNQYGPIVDVLKEMHIGDSVSVIFSHAQLRMPPGSIIFDHIQYDMKLMRLRSQREFVAENDSLKAVFQNRVESIKATAPAAESLFDSTRAQWSSLDKETTPGGVEYLIHETGSGPVAAPGDTLPIYFIGAFDDGQIFDNSIAAGMPFWFIYGMGGVIPAWDEVFQYIPEGSKATMYVPYNLAYGVAGSPPKIPESSDLFFYVEVGLKD